jgi:hypothetical protein
MGNSMDREAFVIIIFIVRTQSNRSIHSNAT